MMTSMILMVQVEELLLCPMIIFFFGIPLYYAWKDKGSLNPTEPPEWLGVMVIIVIIILAIYNSTSK